jgi:NAD(P)-dependent dehydrogenase (short-subunit alcohol dehydrogenase family)
MTSGLQGKVAVVTGAAGGLGAASALRLSREGCSVVAFLLSDDAAYMTGEVVSVDGGSSIVSTVRPSGGAGAWDFGALDERTYGREE